VVRKIALTLIVCLISSAPGLAETVRFGPPGAQTSNTFFGPPKPERTAQAVTDKPGPASSPEYVPGWVVELRTFSLHQGRLTPDPGNIAAYVEPGPIFAEETFAKQSGAAQGQQPIAGGASSKFAAHDPGTYQFGMRVEVPYRDMACYETLSLNGTVLSERRVDYRTPVVTVSPIELVPGLYDVTLIFGCETHKHQTTVGKLTVLVAHPNELAPVPARAGDFVRPVKSRYQVPESSERKSFPAFTPTDRLPSPR
jgi:hypothetical protein